ncbi:MAG: XrtA/PEP-CTERM system amidotransferase [Alphaproteobacteria bacterium]
MCGLSGYFDPRGQRPVDRALLLRMNDAIRHRGPDGDGVHLAPGIGLAHRRLAIIDVAHGAQPLYNEDNTVAIVFNGEIYNFQPLMAELESLGHRFRTRCDTEVIVHGWEEWGPDCVKRFRGMFAFALWDSNTETLFMARDRLGKKPLYYAVLPDETLIFASELKALMRHPGFRRDIDPRAVEDYFALGYVPEPRTIYQGAAKLEPAERMVWRRGAAMKRDIYWHLKMSESGPADLDDAETELRERLDEAVRLRMISDVPLGAFLSGGVDSSGIVALMAGQSDRPVNTFSIGFGDRAFDESAYALQIAQRYETNHEMRVVDPDSFDLVDRLAGIYDEPFADSSAMPTFRVCALAREHVTVALSGDGGDEAFAGYRRYLWHHREGRLRSILPAAIGRPVFGALARIYPKMDWAPRMFRARNTFEELAMTPEAAFFHSVSVSSDAMRNRIFSPEFRRALQGHHAIETLSRHMAAADTDVPLLQAQYADIKTWLPGDILVKTDRASMANSLEVRAPLLDHEIVEWASTLPVALKLDGANGKRILKRAFEPLVPDDLLYRPKQGFSIPLASWFRGPLAAKVRQTVTGPAMAECGWFDMAVLKTLVDRHQSGLHDHSPVLWSLLMFDGFLRQAG